MPSGWRGGCPPVSYLLRGCLHDRRARFRGLPGSQRHAGSDDEHAEIRRGHVTVLAGLLGRGGADAGREVLLLTASWPGSPGPAARDAEPSAAEPAASCCRSVPPATASRSPARTRLRASASRLHGSEPSRLLRLAADPARMSWPYHPYDSGTDATCATSDHKDEPCRQHQDWLSPHPSGL